MIQCFAVEPRTSSFEGTALPRLLAASKIDSYYTVHPRVLHKHDDFLEILFVRSGSGVYIIDEKRYAIREGDIILCNAGVLHDEDPSCSKELNTYNVAITNVHVKGLPENHLIAADFSPIFPAGECAETVSSLMSMIHSMLAGNPQTAAETCQYLTAALLSKLLLAIRRHCDMSGDTVHTRTDIIVAQVKNYINTHFDESFTLQDISESIRISPYHLSHVFKAQTGYSPMQYTLRRRLGEAQTLLISTKMSVTEISVAVGFGNPCHFNTMFSKHIGMSPSKYRDSYVDKDGVKPPEMRNLL